ncbi:MAG: EpsG family protein [Bacteroides thetaiotaomicron]|nr:EpsG family protein [Bacteroides thetaiotaomicron]
MAFFAILIPSILGGLRSVSVGTDNTVYSYAFSKIASMASPVQAISEGQFEPLYNLLCYIVSRFSTDYHWMCFASEFITMFFIVMALKHYRNEIPIYVSLLVYLFCQYCNFLNLVRQGIAISICLFALRYAFERKPIPYICLIIVAALFHNSALIALFIYVIFRIVDKDYSFLKQGVLLLVCIVAIQGTTFIVNNLISIGILPDKYTEYIGTGVTFSLFHTVVRLPVLLTATLFYRPLVDQVPKYRYLYILLWIEIIVVQLSSVFDPAYRMSLYFNIATFLIIPTFPLAVVEGQEQFVRIGTYLYVFCYWVFLQ